MVIFWVRFVYKHLKTLSSEVSRKPLLYFSIDAQHRQICEQKLYINRIKRRTEIKLHAQRAYRFERSMQELESEHLKFAQC